MNALIQSEIYITLSRFWANYPLVCTKENSDYNKLFYHYTTVELINAGSLI